MAESPAREGSVMLDVGGKAGRKVKFNALPNVIATISAVAPCHVFLVDVSLFKTSKLGVHTLIVIDMSCHLTGSEQASMGTPDCHWRRDFSCGDWCRLRHRIWVERKARKLFTYGECSVRETHAPCGFCQCTLAHSIILVNCSSKRCMR